MFYVTLDHRLHVCNVVPPASMLPRARVDGRGGAYGGPGVSTPQLNPN